MSTDSMSARLGMRGGHHDDETVEQVAAVMGAGIGFRMALEAERRFFPVADALHGAVEQRHVGEFEMVGQGIGVHDASAAFTSDLRKLWAYQDDAWIATANKAGVDGRAALDYFRAEAKKIYQARSN